MFEFRLCHKLGTFDTNGFKYSRQNLLMYFKQSSHKKYVIYCIADRVSRNIFLRCYDQKKTLFVLTRTAEGWNLVGCFSDF